MRKASGTRLPGIQSELQDSQAIKNLGKLLPVLQFPHVKSQHNNGFYGISSRTLPHFVCRSWQQRRNPNESSGQDGELYHIWLQSHVSQLLPRKLQKLKTDLKNALPCTSVRLILTSKGSSNKEGCNLSGDHLAKYSRYILNHVKFSSKQVCF